MGANDNSPDPKGADKAELCRKLTAEIRKLREKSRSRLSNAQVDEVLSNTSTGNRSKLPDEDDDCRVWRIKSFLTKSKLRSFILTLTPIAVGLLIFFNRESVVAFFDDPCLIGSNFVLSEIGRPLAACEQCRNLTSVPVYETITPAEFLARHAYSMRPALITGATASWTAMDTFSYDYFKDLYGSHPGALEAVENECQFFPYNTEFASLAEAFQMSDDRAALKEGEKNWYFGWSNCDPLVAGELRKHYKKPYFIPESSESSALDWIFMGGPGKGAGIHLDSVEKPSWQAQLSGKKTWTLIPLPECENICHKMQVTVNTGDIIVLDTNQWYHATQIHPGKISITIGSEFD